MQLTIKPEHQEIIEAKLRTGRYQSADEVVERALELLFEQEGEEHARVEALRRDIMIGIEQADRGECTPWDTEAFLKRVHREYEERHGRKA